MKFLSEYRSPEVAQALLHEIRQLTTRSWKIMEVCGGQTHSLVKNGILSLLPSNIQMIHGPGCPVCVTPVNLIDKAVHLAATHGVILCSFGDMIRVPGSGVSLLEAKARGADVRVLYSPLEAVKIARENPDREVVFFAVGFETTAPANALSVLHAKRDHLPNYSLLTSHVVVPAAIEAILNDPLCRVHGILGAGHVCAIMGLKEYHPLVRDYRIPIVVTGFEPVDLLEGILMTVRQLESGQAKLENQYSRVVSEEGNKNALQIISEIFDITDRPWRGLGNMQRSGFRLKDQYAPFDAEKKFTFMLPVENEDPECIAGDIMKGIKKPFDCRHFGKKCNPANPLGAPMVSSEGACAAYYHYTTYAEKSMP